MNKDYQEDTNAFQDIAFQDIAFHKSIPMYTQLFIVQSTIFLLDDNYYWFKYIEQNYKCMSF